MRRNLGFTLLEVALALAVMAGSIVIVATAWSGNFGRIRRAQVLNNVHVLLQRKMTELEAKNAGKKSTEISEEEGDFGSEFPDYRWKFEVQPFVMPDLSSLLVKEKDGASEMLLTIMTKMQETMSKAITEGRLTVFVKTEKSELKYTLTSYFVDYEQDINFIGGP